MSQHIDHNYSTHDEKVKSADHNYTKEPVSTPDLSVCKLEHSYSLEPSSPPELSIPARDHTYSQLIEQICFKIKKKIQPNTNSLKDHSYYMR